MAANLTNPLVGKTNRVLTYVHIPILDIMETPWSQLIYQTNAEVVSITIAIINKVITNEIIKNDNQTRYTRLAIDRADNETRLTIRINPIIPVIFITVFLNPEAIKIINRI